MCCRTEFRLRLTEVSKLSILSVEFETKQVSATVFIKYIRFGETGIWAYRRCTQLLTVKKLNKFPQE